MECELLDSSDEPLIRDELVHGETTGMAVTHVGGIEKMESNGPPMEIARDSIGASWLLHAELQGTIVSHTISNQILEGLPGVSSLLCKKVP